MATMASTPSRSDRRPLLRVGILRSPDDIEANVWAVMDVLRSVNKLAFERYQSTPAHWAWLGTPPPPGGPEPFTPDAADPRPTANLDVIVIPGWLAPTGPLLRQSSQSVPPGVRSLLQAHVARGAPILSLFNGTALLADAGLLAGREAAIPWAFAPSIGLLCDAPFEWLRERPWHTDGALWTTAALSGTLEALFDLLKQTAIAELAAAVASVLLFDTQRQVAAAAVVESPTRQPLSAGSLERARRWLQAHSDQPYDLAATARAAATSPRTLLRWFAQAHRQTPLDYLHSLRVAQAKTLLQTTYLTVEAIAHQCGYADVGSLRKLFVRITGMTPGAYRQRYQLRTSRRQWTGPEVAPATDTATPR